MYEKFFPERLMKLRIKNGVSARDMSLSLGQADNYINGIENKKSFPSMASFFCICDYLKITPKDFFDNETENPSLINELVNVLKQLDEKTLRHLLGFVESMLDKKL